MNHQPKGEMMDEGKKNGRCFAFPVEGCANSFTKREYFAAMAMQGLMANPVKGSFEEFSKFSVSMADALLAELAKTEVGG